MLLPKHVKLQSNQSSAGHPELRYTISDTDPSIHLAPVMPQSPWLPVKHRLSYKILLCTEVVMYLNAVVQKHKPVRLLRSEFGSVLRMVRINTVTHGRRSFSYSSHCQWYSLHRDQACNEVSTFS